MQPEDLSQDGRMVLRGVTENGVPGQGRRVRIILIAKFYESPPPSRSPGDRAGRARSVAGAPTREDALAVFCSDGEGQGDAVEGEAFAGAWTM